MPRPPDVPDPRDADAPVRIDDFDEDRARTRTSIRQLLQDAHEDPESAVHLEDDGRVTGLEEPDYEEPDLDVDEEELRELRYRRDRILDHMQEDRGGR